MASGPLIKPLASRMRLLLYAAAVLVFLAGVQLFVFPERTERYFAWTIEPPLTAAFLGAAYWSSVAFEAIAARQRRWADARIAVPAVLVFTLLTLVVTLVHIDSFHLGSEHELATRAVTWGWIFIYAVVPLLMTWLIVGQERVPGGDPRLPPASPPVWLIAAAGLQALVLAGLGIALLAVPRDVAEIWPWTLTPLAGRAIGAWLFSLGLGTVHAMVERDVRRLRPAAAAGAVFAILQGVALLRFLDTPDWSEPEPILYVLFLASVLLTGVSTLRLGRDHRA